MQVLWKKSSRNKRMILKVSNGVVIVSTPYSVSRVEAEAFVKKNQAWIAKQLKKDAASILQAGQTISLLGQTYVLKEADSCFTMDNSCYFCRDEKKWKAFLLAYAQDFIAERFVYWSTKMGQDSLSLKFGFYKSKWGSCRRDTREIRLNGYLALCSPHMIDAVIVHELCHLKFPNHSSRFYQEVLFWFPDYYKEYKKLRSIKMVRTK